MVSFEKYCIRDRECKIMSSYKLLKSNNDFLNLGKKTKCDKCMGCIIQKKFFMNAKLIL